MQSLCGKWTGMNYSWQLNELFFAEQSSKAYSEWRQKSLRAEQQRKRVPDDRGWEEWDGKTEAKNISQPIHPMSEKHLTII